MERGSSQPRRPAESALPAEVTVVSVGVGDLAPALEAADDRLRVAAEPTGEAALDRVGSAGVDCLVVGTALDAVAPVALLREARERRPYLAVVLVAPPTADLLRDAVAADVDRYCPAEGTPDASAVAADVLAAVADRVRERSQLDRLTEGFMMLDEEFRLTYLNETAAEVIRAAAETERSRVAYVGRSLLEEVPEVVGTVFHEKYEEAMDTQEPVSFEAYYEPLEEWFEVSVYPSETGVSVYFPTTTERREFETELKRRQGVLRDLYRITADKDRTFEEKVDALLDIGRSELGTDYGVLSSIENGDYVVERVRPDGDELSNGDRMPLSWTTCEVAVTNEETLVINDVQSNPEVADREGNVRLGVTCYLGTPITVDGEVTGTFCFFDAGTREQPFSEWETTLVDLMGEWVSYERERRQREKRLTRERDRLDQFASVVSHDLRNPLNVAQARLELLAEETDTGGDHVAAIDRSLDRMTTLIEDVLSLARLGKEVVDADRTRLERVVTDAWETAGVDGSLAFEGPAEVVGDETRLQRLFENLFRNAREHAAGADGAVTVEVGPLPDGFYVADDGPGIPESEREEVFESGYSTAEGGTGFGLPIVREIAEAHGWAVRVVDSAAGGARFEVTGVSGVRTDD